MSATKFQLAKFFQILALPPRLLRLRSAHLVMYSIIANSVSTIFYLSSFLIIQRWPSYAKHIGFFEIYVCPHGQGGRGWASLDIFRTNRGEGTTFSRFCADILYWQPLVFFLILTSRNGSIPFVSFSIINFNEGCKEFSLL